MRKTTAMWAMAGIAAAVTGARAQDAQQGAHGSIVLPAGDMVSGRLRGFETHVFEAHLAKGDVYSFKVSADGASKILLHLTLRDPKGHEINAESRVRHLNYGRRVTVGPFRAASTGAYSIELYDDGPYDGDYVGVSSVRHARTSYRLPTDKTPVYVPVPAGGLIRLRSKGTVARLVAALPGQAPHEFVGSDAFVATLSTRGLSSSASGTFGFAAPASAGATIVVSRPRWKSSTVKFPTLPDDPALAAQRLEWFLGWQPQPQQPATPGAVDVPVAPASYGAPAVAADRTTLSGPAAATLFVNAPLDAGTGAIFGKLSPVNTRPASFVPFKLPGDPAPVPSVDLSLAVSPAPTVPPTTPPADDDPSDAPPTTPPVVAPPAVAPYQPDFWIKSIYDRPLLPSFEASQAIGRSAFLLDSAAGQPRWRNAPWTTVPLAYPARVYDCLLPITDVLIHESADAVRGPASDPFVRRTFTNRQKFGLYGVGTDRDGAVLETVVRYYVDGHQVSDLLLTGGDATVTWTVRGDGHTNSNEAWTIEGAWSMSMRAATAESPAVCVLSGSERYKAGALSETVGTEGMTISQVNVDGDAKRYDVVGTITNDLTAADIGLTQHETRVLQPIQFVFGEYAKALVLTIDTNSTTTTTTADWRGAYWFAATR